MALRLKIKAYVTLFRTVSLMVQVLRFYWGLPPGNLVLNSVASVAMGLSGSVTSHRR